MGLYVVLEGVTSEDEVSVLAAATSDDYSEELNCTLNEGVYECVGLQERPGSYTVTATINGASQEQDVTLDDDGCHVVPETITFEGAAPPGGLALLTRTLTVIQGQVCCPREHHDLTPCRVASPTSQEPRMESRGGGSDG